MSDSRDLKSTAPLSIDAFLDHASRLPAVAAAGARLLFALDATASRQATWDLASQLQGEMFAAAHGLGGLQLQLAWFRGLGEFEVSPWVKEGAALQQRMAAVRCRAGQTQIARVLRHALAERARGGLAALVYVGDAMEESAAELAAIAGQLGLQQVPAFVFLEGQDALAEGAFASIARLSGGALCPFDAGSAAQLGELLRAVATYAAGGRAALRRLPGGAARRLLAQLPGAAR